MCKNVVVAAACVVVFASVACGPPCEKDGDGCVAKPRDGTLVVRSLGDWNALEGVTRIEGNLEVVGVSDHESFGVSTSLLGIAGDVDIDTNPGLPDVGFLARVFVGGIVHVTHNQALASVSVTDEQAHVDIADNPALEHVSIEAEQLDTLSIAGAPKLASVETDRALISVGSFTLVDTGLVHASIPISSIGALTVTDNAALTTTPFGTDAMAITGLDVENNAALTDLSAGIILAHGITSMVVKNNAALNACEPASLAILDGVDGADVSDNGGTDCALPPGAACDDSGGLTCASGVSCNADALCEAP